MTASPAPARRARPITETLIRRLWLWARLWLARLGAALPYLGGEHAALVARRLSFIEYAVAVLLFREAMDEAPAPRGAHRPHLHLVRRRIVTPMRSIRRLAHNALLARVRAHGTNFRKRIDALAALIADAGQAKSRLLRRLEAGLGRLRALNEPCADRFIVALAALTPPAAADSS